MHILRLSFPFYFNLLYHYDSGAEQMCQSSYVYFLGQKLGFMLREGFKGKQTIACLNHHWNAAVT